jgi:hypothetical protein
MTDPIPSELLGTWKLVSIVRKEVPSGASTDLLGPDPVGFINLGADGRMIVCIARSDRPRPSGGKISAKEAEELFRGLISYAGAVSVKGNEITFHVEVSWNELWTGTDQKRLFKLENGRAVLSTPVSPDPVDGKLSVRSMTWERLK